MNQQYSYLVGGLEASAHTPAKEQEILNECGAQGWKLVAVVPRFVGVRGYIYYYLRRDRGDEEIANRPRFNFDLIKA